MQGCKTTLQALALLALWAIPGYAAEAGKEPSVEKTDKSALSLEPVVVTARKRSEDAQEIPVSITTITTNDIIDTGLEGMDKVMMLTPGLFGMQSAQSTSSSFNIRGIGALMPPGGFEDGFLSAYVDGVPIPIGQLDNYILDVDQIEVLRGPQGTLYGKSSQAGAINITTVAPSDTLQARVGTTLGNMGKRGLNAMVTGPIVEGKVNGRLFLDTQTKESVIQNDATGDPLGNVERLFGRASLDANWSDGFSSRLNLGYDRLRNEDNIMVSKDGYDKTNTNRKPREKRETLSVGFINAVDLSKDITLNLITGYDHITFDTITLQTTGALPVVDDTENHFNQEIRLDGTHGPWEWTTGIFGSYFKRDLHQTVDVLGVEDKGDQTTTTLAAFGEATYALTETLKATAGVRINKDRKTVDETVVRTGFLNYTHTLEDSKTFTAWNGRFALAYTPTDEHTFFGTVGRGYKAGGYQMYHQTAMTIGPIDTPGFDEAVSHTFELGYKGLFFDKRMSFDTSAFYTMTEGEHILYFTPGFQSLFENLDTRSYGLELATRGRVTETFTLGGNLSLIRAELAEGGTLGISGTVNEGDQLPNVPAYSGLLFGEYRDAIPMPGFDISGFARLDYVFEDQRWFEATHDTRGRHRNLFNLRLGLENDTFSLAAYADNLTDQKYCTYALTAGGQTLIRPARGRELGLTLSVNF